jgi:hypothetical protein
MTTVLLWGDRWWLPHHKIPVPFASLDTAADLLAAAWHARLKSIRLLYQPDSLVTTATACPNGNRATLALALGSEHPALVHPGHVWSHEPILSRAGSYATLLHYETRPALFALVQRLEEHGFTVTSVWPLATWLNAIPPDLSDSGAMTIIAFSADRYCLYRHSTAGERTVVSSHGPDVLPAIAGHVREAGRNPTEFVLYITTDDSLLDALGDLVELADGQVGGMATLSAALAKSVVLPPRHPAQLLPPLPKVSGRRLVQAATVMVMTTALALAALAGRDFVQARAVAAEQAGALPGLRADVAALRRQAAAISAPQKLRTPGLPAGQLLAALGQRLPPSAVLTAIQADAAGFKVVGGIAGRDLAAAPWRAWLGGLQDSTQPWQLTGPDAPPPAGEFILRGAWQ